ncbi:MAG: electron transfer flavoprotein subunit alpha/FixB family protein [Chloroflexi bacterium]|nr:electron transfer flavoprotein subunit alpha/FixB family protein [Anaerolineae bacterium]MBL1171743.1 electron transfer flavoprotein subunit alpha/FixB family protein [Chloroflexota bacterium]MDL1926187.1 electron transfer flavoprotein subunit alpha/FixB family protein [Anaerolineae bacterium AMX1]WKZ53603.1 MAG: electron transfer flavoprotein subunit alpha/FixB family protein [Anaerolineales bacterium]NOG75212.1 electron transfer flavoprotein subunit alpha/FixB family protein [Chloroflexota
MSNDILVITEHMDGKFSDVSFEMVGKAKELASAWGGQAVAIVVGSGVDAGAFASHATIHVDDAALSQFNPEAYGKVVEALVREKSPRLVMFGWTAAGMDLAAWLSARMGVPCATAVKEIGADGTMSCQAYGGKLIAEVAPEGGMAIAACLAGSFDVEAGRGSTAATTMASPVDLSGLKVKFVEAIKPAAGDVDITVQAKLVSIGRGIGGKENVELAEELAEKLGAVVSASRPVVDAGWLPRTRQVGKSGLKVKPKLYLMLGISGAPEHLEGMKDAELIIAVNTDKKAPIFNVAHYGATNDLFEVAEAMLELL